MPLIFTEAGLMKIRCKPGIYHVGLLSNTDTDPAYGRRSLFFVFSGRLKSQHALNVSQTS